jgi:hypothetical protein
MCFKFCYRNEDCIDACFRPPITIKSQFLHVGDIRRALGEIPSYHKKD